FDGFHRIATAVTAIAGSAALFLLSGIELGLVKSRQQLWCFYQLSILCLHSQKRHESMIVCIMLIRLTPKHTSCSVAAETRCRHARRCPAPRGSALSGFTARVPTPLS